MKICSQCRKTYDDDNLNFCLEDGGALAFTDQAAPTVMMPPARETAAPPRWQAPAPQAQSPKSSKTWLWVLLILGLLLVLCGGGGIGGFLLLRHNKPSLTLDKPTPVTPSSDFPAPSKTVSIPSKTTKSDGFVTLENYEKLKIDMERSEVEGILGGKGVEISSSKGGGMTFSVNKWEGDNFKSIILTFKNDKIMTKTQVGLDK